MIFDKDKREFVKRICLPINSEKRLKDINTFFEFFCDIEKQHKSFLARICEDVSNNGVIMTTDDFYKIKTKNADASITLMNKSVTFKNRDNAFANVISFLELWDYLKENNLIRIIEKDPNKIKEFKFPLLNQYAFRGGVAIPLPDNDLWLLIKNYVLFEIIPLSELNNLPKGD